MEPPSYVNTVTKNSNTFHDNVLTCPTDLTKIDSRIQELTKLLTQRKTPLQLSNNIRQ